MREFSPGNRLEPPAVDWRLARAQAMAKGKNHQSKRTALHTKYKIQKKVREHHRKERKALKDKIKKGGGSLEYRKKKDPGIPNAWPFKEDMLHEVEQWKDMKQKERMDLLLERKRERERARKASMSQADQIAELKRNAARAQGEFAVQEQELALSSSRAGKADVENTKRAYYRELRKIVDTADVILVVLDARDPLGCRPLEVERYIMNVDPNKRVVLVLNKIDLVPKENVTAWVKYLRRELPTVAMKCSTQQQKMNLGRSKASGMDAGGENAGSECIGGEQLLQLLKNYSRNSDMKMAVTVGVVGYPNVGKSSLINSLVRTRAVETGAQAGITKKAQAVQLDKKVKLLDCPGIVFAKDETDVSVILRNCVKIDAVIDPLPAFQEIVRRCDKMKLMTLYKTARFGTDQEFLQMVARARGKVKKGGILDLEMSARTVLTDWVQGKIPYCTKPPVIKESIHDETSIVASWGKEFDLSSINQVAVIDEACTQLDDAFMALQGLSIGSSTADMGFTQPEDAGHDSMDTEEGQQAPAPQPGRAREGKDSKIQADARNARVTKEARASRKEAAAAAVRKQQEVADEDSDYDFNEAFAGEQGQFGALAEQGESEDESGEEDGMSDAGMQED